jgi:hypothetical protein
MSLYAQLKYSSEQLKKLAREREALWPPPISFSLMGKFSKPKSSSDKDDKKEEGQYVKFEVPLNCADPNNKDKYERKVKIFSDGKAFEWCELREHTEDLFDAFGCQGPLTNNANKRHHLYIAIFAGRAKEVYMTNYNRINMANNQKQIEYQSSDAEVLQLVVNETAKAFFNSWDTAIQDQQQYMRQNLFLGELKPSVFIERLKRMNKFLTYFPRADIDTEEDKLLISEEQLITIVHHASHGIMQLQIQRSGKTINAFKTLDDLKVFFEQQYECDLLEKRILKGDEHGKDHKKGKKNKRAKKQKQNDDDDAEKAAKGDRKPSAKPKCTICGKIGHRDENCWTLDKNAKKRPASFQTTNSILKKSKYAKKSPSSKTEAFFTEEQVSVMMGKVMASMKEKYGGKKKPKRQVQFSEPSDSDSDSDSDSNDKKIKDEDIPYSFAYTYLFDYDRNIEAPLHQRQNTARYSAEIIVEIVDSQNKVVPIRALLDTGTSETILLKLFFITD